MSTEIKTHTHGPWIAATNSHYWEVQPVSGVPFTVGDVCSSEPGNRDGGLQEANARLISAAPEMLESLKVILEFYRQGAPIDQAEACAMAFDLGWKAIAKAEGR